MNKTERSVETGDLQELLALTTEIVSAYLSNNGVAGADLPGLIEQVHASLAQIVSGDIIEAGAVRSDPAVSIKKSVTPDHLVCLEDGRKLKTLRRHLSAEHGLTPDEYRVRWGLAPDYPMVAPSYAAKRSDIAKKLGLGSKGGRRKR